MTYTILERTTTITTLVEYDFDGVKVQVSISHFQPQSEDDIIKGIENRAIIEQQNLNNNNI